MIHLGKLISLFLSLLVWGFADASIKTVAQSGLLRSREATEAATKGLLACKPAGTEFDDASYDESFSSLNEPHPLGFPETLESLDFYLGLTSHTWGEDQKENGIPSESHLDRSFTYDMDAALIGGISYPVTFQTDLLALNSPVPEVFKSRAVSLSNSTSFVEIKSREEDSDSEISTSVALPKETSVSGTAASRHEKGTCGSPEEPIGHLNSESELEQLKAAHSPEKGLPRTTLGPDSHLPSWVVKPISPKLLKDLSNARARLALAPRASTSSSASDQVRRQEVHRYDVQSQSSCPGQAQDTRHRGSFHKMQAGTK